MDTIQKALVKAGRKDLAQEYYLKVAVNSSKVYKEYIDATGKRYTGWSSIFNKYKGFIPDRLVEQFEKQVIDFLERANFQNGMLSKKMESYPAFKQSTVLLKLILKKYPKLLEALKDGGYTSDLYLDNSTLAEDYIEKILKDGRFSTYSREADYIKKNPKLLKYVLDKDLMKDDKWTLMRMVQDAGKFQKEFADKYPDIAYEDKEMRQYVPKKKQVSTIEKLISEGNTDPIELLTIINYIKDERRHNWLLGLLIKANPNNKELAQATIKSGYFGRYGLLGILDNNENVDFDYDVVLGLLESDTLQSDYIKKLVKKYAPKYPKLVKDFYTKKRFHARDIESVAEVGQLDELIEIMLKKNEFDDLYHEMKDSKYFDTFFKKLKDKFKIDELKDMIPPADFNKLIRPKKIL